MEALLLERMREGLLQKQDICAASIPVCTGAKARWLRAPMAPARPAFYN
jgi:hypothetical protein